MVSEEKSFESVDGRQTEASHPMSYKKFFGGAGGEGGGQGEG